MNDNTLISELTVGEFTNLLRKTVQQAMSEVLIEFSLAAEQDAEMIYQAEMNDLLRASLSERLPGYSHSSTMVDD